MSKFFVIGNKLINTSHVVSITCDEEKREFSFEILGQDKPIVRKLEEYEIYEKSHSRMLQEIDTIVI